MKKITVLSFLLLLLGLGNVRGENKFVINIGQYKYTTFAPPLGVYSVTVAEGITVYKIQGVTGDLEESQEAGIDFRLRLTEIELPANRTLVSTEQVGGFYALPPMILFSETEGGYDLPYTAPYVSPSKGRSQASDSQTCQGVYSFDNMLIPGREGMDLDEVMANMIIDEKVTELDNYLRDKATSRSVDDDSYYYYKLSTKTDNSGTRVGFFWGAEDGGKFTPTGYYKAYLTIPKSFFNASSAKKFRLIDESGLFSSNVATGITLTPRGDAPELMIEEAAVYDLQGRKVANPQPGHIYIRNGKKFIK